MLYSFETNVCIEYLRGKNGEIIRRFIQVHISQIIICSVVRSELLYGARKSQNPAAEKAKVERFLSLFGTRPYDDAAADRFVDQRLRLEQAGMVIGSFDPMIASITLAEGLVQVSHNTAEFSRISGLVIEDWEAP